MEFQSSNHIPHGVEDETGDRPLLERARWLKHAEFFVGLSSGLSWLAWAMDVPVVLISGFTAATNEFATPYRGHQLPRLQRLLERPPPPLRPP